MPRKKATPETTPAAPVEGFFVGDVIELQAPITNEGKTDLSGTTVTFSHGIVTPNDTYTADANTAIIESLKPGETVTVFAAYTATDDDVGDSLNVKTIYNGPGFYGEAETGPIAVALKG